MTVLHAGPLSQRTVSKRQFKLHNTRHTCLIEFKASVVVFHSHLPWPGASCERQKAGEDSVGRPWSALHLWRGLRAAGLRDEAVQRLAQLDWTSARLQRCPHLNTPLFCPSKASSVHLSLSVAVVSVCGAKWLILGNQVHFPVGILCRCKNIWKILSEKWCL